MKAFNGFLLALAASVGLLLNTCAFFFQDDFFVPDDFFTIQQAIDFARPGDTIFINRGTYSPFTNGEQFPIFMKDGVNLVGKDPEATIIDAANTNGVLDCFNYNGLISNLTLQNGLNTRGGGIFAQNSTITMENLYILGNRAFEAGSGVYLKNSDGTILRNSVIAHNAETSSSSEDPAQVAVVDSDISFTNNAVAQGDSDGIRLSEGASGTYENNIFYQNGSGSFGAGFADTATDTAATIRYNLLFENAQADFFLNGMSLTAEEANALEPDDQIADNFDANPLFTDPGDDDFTLQSGSPAINAGDPDSSFNNPDGSRNTLGAYGGPNARDP